MRKYNKEAFSIIIAISLTLLMALMSFYILEFIVPFSKNTKGIENASIAYYEAEGAVEEALYEVENNSLGYSTNTSYGASAVENEYDLIGRGQFMPRNGEGASEFSSSYNIIKSGLPIQLEVGNNEVDWSHSSTKFYFRVPDIRGSYDEVLSGAIDRPIINWQLTTEKNILNATGSWITIGDIGHSNTTITSREIDFTGFDGVDLDGNTYDFDFYYGNHCGVGSGCVLKLSIISSLSLDLDNTPVPYIEWLANFNNSIALRYANIEAKGKSYGFKKELKVKVPQQTVNEAFDFTVFQ